MTKPHRNEAEREAAKKKSKKEHYERKKKDPNFLATKAQRERERRKAKKRDAKSMKHEIEVLKLENEYKNKNEAGRVSAILQGYQLCVRGINATRDTSEATIEEGRKEVVSAIIQGYQLCVCGINATRDTSEATIEEGRKEVALRKEAETQADPISMANRASKERERREPKKPQIELMKLENEAARVSAIKSGFEICLRGINAPFRVKHNSIERFAHISTPGIASESQSVEDREVVVSQRNETPAGATAEFEPPLEEEREITSPNNAPRSHLRSSGFRNEYIDFSESAAASSFQLGVPRSQVEDVIRHGKILKQDDCWTTYVEGNVEVLVFDDVDHQSWTVDSITKEDRHMSRAMKANDFGRYPRQKSDMDLYERGRLATAKKFSKLQNVENDLWVSEEIAKAFESESNFWEDRCLKAEDHNHDYERMKDIAVYDSREHKYWKDRCLKVENHYRHRYDHNHDEHCVNDDHGRDNVESSVESSHSCGDYESDVSDSGKRHLSRTTRDSGYKRSKTSHQYD